MPALDLPDRHRSLTGRQDLELTLLAARRLWLVTYSFAGTSVMDEDIRVRGRTCDRPNAPVQR